MTDPVTDEPSFVHYQLSNISKTFVLTLLFISVIQSLHPTVLGDATAHFLSAVSILTSAVRNAA